MTDTTELFLITGATGKTGAPTVELLCERGFRVRAFVHTLDDRATRLREQGAEVVHGDLLDFDAVSSALVGVSAAYFCYSIDRPRLLEATAIFAQAATEAGVGAVVNMSQSPARREARYYGPREHWIAERLLDRTHMMTTHLRPTLFADWLSWQWLVEVIGGTPPMTVEQYTTVTRDSLASDGQQTMCEGSETANATIIERL